VHARGTTAASRRCRCIAAAVFSRRQLLLLLFVFFIFGESVVKEQLWPRRLALKG
jgi:hypothetical protein